MTDDQSGAMDAGYPSDKEALPDLDLDKEALSNLDSEKEVLLDLDYIEEIFP